MTLTFTTGPCPNLAATCNAACPCKSCRSNNGSGLCSLDVEAKDICKNTLVNNKTITETSFNHVCTIPTTKQTKKLLTTNKKCTKIHLLDFHIRILQRPVVLQLRPLKAALKLLDR